MKSVSRIVSLMAVGLFITASVAWGHTQTVLDSDDSEGPLDIVAARQAHENVTWLDAQGYPTEIVVVKVLTYETWDNDVIDQGGHRFISFEFNLDKSQDIERCFVMNSNASETFGIMYKNCKYFDDHSMGLAIPARRIADGHGIRGYFPRKWLGNKESFRWRAVTSYEQEGPPCAIPDPHGDGGYGTCADFTRWKRHSD